MSAEGKYTECCLNLNMNSSIEERRLTFEEMAPNWDKVYSALNYLISPLPCSFHHSPLSLPGRGCPPRLEKLTKHLLTTGRFNFHKDLWNSYWEHGKNWPVADWRVLSNDPGDLCAS